MTVPLLHDPAYPRLKGFLIEATGLAYYADKDGDLASRVQGRISASGAAGAAAYLGLLQEEGVGGKELEALTAELTIGETYFFRHQELFDALRDLVLPDLIGRNQQRRRLRIWSAGCATGSEPYSLAMLLKREFATQLAGWEVDILGTDINRRFLANAREGRFEDWALRALSEELKQSCFSRAEKAWILAAQYREEVSFQYHNLVRDPFPSLVDGLLAFDLILCRNVLIYFDQETIQRLAGQFHQCLVEGGWLGVGHAEPNTEVFRAFHPVNAPGAVLYQKRPPATEPDAPLSGTQRVLPVQSAPPAWSALPLPAPRSGAEEAPGPPLPSPPSLAEVRRWADRGEYERAAQHCEALLKEDQLNPRVYFYYAVVLEQTGPQANGEAEQALRRAIYLDREYPLAHYHLGLLLQKRGDGRGALRAFENARRLLARMAPGQTFEEGDGIDALSLKRSTEMHLEILGGA